MALALLLQAPSVECTTLYAVRVTWEMSPAQWQTVEIGPLVLTREEAMDRRLTIEREGYTLPNLIPGGESEQHITAAAIKRASVKRLCCHSGPNIPLPEWWCAYPDGPPPPEF